MKNLIVTIMILGMLTSYSFAARNYVHDSRSVAYSNSGSDLASGQLVDLGDRYGVAVVDIDSGDSGTVYINGVWSFQRADTNAITAGANVYYNSASNVTGTAASDKYVGQCTEAVPTCLAVTNSLEQFDKFVKVDLNVPQRKQDITVTLETGTVTAEGANDLVTPDAALTEETSDVTAEGANDLVTPDAALTEETGIVTAEGANDLVTPDAAMSLETATHTNYYDPVAEYARITNANFSVTNEYDIVTNITWSTVVFVAVTNSTCAITPDLASNAVVAVTVTGGDAVWTNATCAITPDLASNAVVAVTVTGGAAVWTNATCAITPDLASNAVVEVTVTGGDAVVTNATADNF